MQQEQRKKVGAGVPAIPASLMFVHEFPGYLVFLGTALMLDVDSSSRLLISVSRRLLMFGSTFFFFEFFCLFFVSFDGTHSCSYYLRSLNLIWVLL